MFANALEFWEIPLGFLWGGFDLIDVESSAIENRDFNWRKLKIGDIQLWTYIAIVLSCITETTGMNNIIMHYYEPWIL